MSGVVLWTRDPGAHETIPLVLSRIGQPFDRCRSAEEAVAVLRDLGGPALLVLGPSFTEPEAHALRHTLSRELAAPVTVVLLEDALAPLPPRLVLTATEGPLRLRLPVRPRTLMEVVDAWRAGAGEAPLQWG